MTTADAAGSPAQFTYLRAFAIGGISLSQPEIDLGEIVPHVQVFVTQSLDDHCRQADQALAIAELLLSGLFAPDRPASARDRIQEVVGRNVVERRSRYGQGPFLLLVCRGSVDHVRTDELREVEDMVIGFDAVNKETIRAQFEGAVKSILATIALTLPSVISFQPVVDQVVVHQADSRPIFSYTPRAGSPRIRIIRQVDVDSFAAGARQAALRTHNSDVTRVQDLLLRALLDDRLRAFLAAWTALEILVNKLFSRYEKLLFEDLGRGRPDPLPECLKQIQVAMSSRYRLKDKFIVVASALDPRGSATDLTDFETAKKLRDGLSHGEDLTDEALPLEVTLVLLRKYLALHLNSRAA